MPESWEMPAVVAAVYNRQVVQALTLPPALASCCAQQGNGTWPGEMCRTLWESSGPPVGI